MKRKLLSLLLASLPVFLLLSPSAFAEGKTAAERGYEAIMETGHGHLIVLPKEESYLEEWKTLYGRRAWYAPSLYVESVPLLQSGAPVMPMLFEGTEVTVVAEENDMSCILYRGVNYKPYAGWIPSIRLLEEFPGETYLVGEEPDGTFETENGAALRWSNGYFPGSRQLYTVLDEPLENCVGFSFEYQLIAENTSQKDLVFGPRTIYVRDGEEWIKAGAFPYPELGAVRVQVRLDRPVKLSAIATVADCWAPNMFDFRQTARDFLLLPPETG